MTEPDGGGAHVRAGDVWWVDFDPVAGREQGSRRPAVVVASEEYLASVTHLVLVVPVTTRDRGWPNHVPLDERAGLGRPSFAMTEQPRAISRERLLDAAGRVDEATTGSIRTWIHDFFA
ncbi:MAG: type II toxin-antitoxin system PemK/MazF family toxin [Thermoleophilia bacterium]